MEFFFCPYRTMVSGREKERKKKREGPVDFTTHIVMIQIPVCSSVVILIKKSAPFFPGYNKLEIWCTRAFSVSRFFSVFFFSQNHFFLYCSSIKRMAAMSALFFYFHDIKEKKDNLLMISGMQFQSHYNVSTRNVKREVRRGLANIIFVKNEMEFIQDQQVEDAALCVCTTTIVG